MVATLSVVDGLAQRQKELANVTSLWFIIGTGITAFAINAALLSVALSRLASTALR